MALEVTVINISGDEIVDRDSFHKVFKEKFGFPDYYGNNMDAWIDCMTYIDDPDGTNGSITFSKGQTVIIRMEKVRQFRHITQYSDFLECMAFVNSRRLEKGDPPILAFMPIE